MVVNQDQSGIRISSQCELWPIDKPIPYDRNARTHSAEQVATLDGDGRTFDEVSAERLA